MSVAATKIIKLDFPLPMEGNKFILEITMRRPTTRDIGDAVMLLGGEEIAKVLKTIFKDAGNGDLTTEKLMKSGIVENVIDALSTSLKPELLDGLFGLIARMCSIEVAQSNSLAPEDVSKIFGALLGFFPQTKSPTP